MTRASTPGSLSTRIESVWRSVAGVFISMGWPGFYRGKMFLSPAGNALPFSRRGKTASTVGERQSAASPQSEARATSFRPSHHHLAFLGDRVLEVLRGVAQQHFIVRAARGNHREAILGRIDHAVEDHWAVDREHVADGGIEFGGLRATDTNTMIGLGELDEIRQRLGVA